MTQETETLTAAFEYVIKPDAFKCCKKCDDRNHERVDRIRAALGEIDKQSKSYADIIRETIDQPSLSGLEKLDEHSSGWDDVRKQYIFCSATHGWHKKHDRLMLEEVDRKVTQAVHDVVAKMRGEDADLESRIIARVAHEARKVEMIEGYARDGGEYRVADPQFQDFANKLENES